MNTPARITALCLLSFAIGGGAGWLGRGWLRSGATLGSRSAVVQPTALGSVVSQESPTAGAPGRNARRNDPVGARPIDAAAERLNALVWLKRNGLDHLQLPVFGADGLAPQFIEIFGLSPSETATLNEGIRHARSAILAAARAAATVSVGADKGSVTVNVPSVPGKGGQVYDDLLAQFRNVLGPDRFEQFDAIAGTSFESALDSFGAEASRYELTMRLDQHGRSVFDIKRSFTMPNSSGWTSSTVYPEDLANAFPVLSGLVPPEVRPPPASAN
jgi:hypothetical protein